MKTTSVGALAILVILLSSGCVEKERPVIDRETRIPVHAVKMTPETDVYPPQLESNEWEEPVPSPVNTAGGEDSPFITPDGTTLYFFFTPDVSVPAEKQVIDGVTGIYVSDKTDTGWSKPQRVFLQDPDKMSLDGCEFVQDDMIWFCSAREGNYRGVDMYTAQRVEGRWTHWKNAGEKLNSEYGIGELHVSADGNELYFHADRTGGAGGLDIWMTRKVGGEWSEPTNLEAVNSAESEGWPFLSSDGNELWFLRWYQGSPAIYRSKKSDGAWSVPERIISRFAGEPSLDDEGNLYFVHHYFNNSKMIEADIYVAKKKRP